jgi:hypothetical protein
MDIVTPPFFDKIVIIVAAQQDRVKPVFPLFGHGYPQPHPVFIVPRDQTR